MRPPLGPVTLKLVQQLLAPFNDRYGPTIDQRQAAELGGYEPATVYKLVSEGMFSKSVARRRPLLFLRDVFVWERMNIVASREAKRSSARARRGREVLANVQEGGANEAL